MLSSDYVKLKLTCDMLASTGRICIAPHFCLVFCSKFYTERFNGCSSFYISPAGPLVSSLPHNLTAPNAVLPHLFEKRQATHIMLEPESVMLCNMTLFSGIGF